MDLSCLNEQTNFVASNNFSIPSFPNRPAHTQETPPAGLEILENLVTNQLTHQQRRNRDSW
uniref:Uncharacterized protein n=1 Tax=Rhizophora mucronata TaxID=61149 RepID=A0A2P2MYM5_RHIMU